MLVKETDLEKESPVSITGNCEPIVRSLDVNNEKESIDADDNSFSLNAQRQLGLVFVNDNEITNNASETEVGYDDPEKGSRIPVDYQLLPEEFFEYEGIPPPLVSKTWLKLLYEQLDSSKETTEDSEDESIPLAELKNKLKTAKEVSQTSNQNSKVKLLKSSSNKNHTNNLSDNESDCLQPVQYSPKKCKKSKTVKVKSKENYHVINRKRGRPRKSVNELPPSDQFLNEFDDVSRNNDDDSFWGEIDSPNLDIPLSEEVSLRNEKEEGVSAVINYREHDYFKYSDETGISVVNDGASKSLKKVKVGSVKNEDSKMSFPCLECGKTFSAASTLKNHKRIHDGTLLKCTECHKGFTTNYLLKCHMRIHNGDLFMCHKCGKGFTTAELLKVHSRGHTGDRPFVCNICTRSFPSASNLSQHKQTHDSEKKFLCFQCGSSFSQKRCLDGHMLTHAEKNHICSVCGKLWARKSDLIEHMRVHTGVKPYCCSVCPQKFTQASSLKRHQIVHLDVKPIQCLTCSKMFKCQEYYKRHVRKHEKEADYLFTDIIKDK